MKFFIRLVPQQSSGQLGRNQRISPDFPLNTEVYLKGSSVINEWNWLHLVEKSITGKCS